MRPWQKVLSRVRWGSRPFHTTDFIHQLAQLDAAERLARIESINEFARHGFYRFGITTHKGTERPKDVDGHQAVSIPLNDLVRRIVAERVPSSVALIFEQSKRGDSLVQRDFILDNLGMSSMFLDAVEVDGFFIPKRARVPGMEVADLIAHTAGDNQRHALANKSGFRKSFREMFQCAGGAGNAFYWRVATIPSR